MTRDDVLERVMTMEQAYYEFLKNNPFIPNTQMNELLFKGGYVAAQKESSSILATLSRIADEQR